MAMASSIFRFSSSNLQIKPSRGSQILSEYTASRCSFKKQSNFRDWLNTSKRMQKQKISSVQQPRVPLPPEPPSRPSKSWILPIVFTVVLPFLSNKWGPLLTLKNKVETTLETAEQITNEVEKVAEEVEKVTETITDELPEGGKLRNAAALVEKVAEVAEKDAHLVGDFIEKVEEVEEKVESFVESSIDEAKEPGEIRKAKF